MHPWSSSRSVRRSIDFVHDAGLILRTTGRQQRQRGVRRYHCQQPMVGGKTPPGGKVGLSANGDGI